MISFGDSGMAVGRMGFPKRSGGGVLLDELFAALLDENNNQIWE